MHPGNAHALKRDEYYEAVSKDVVIEGTQKLCEEKWRKASLRK